MLVPGIFQNETTFVILGTHLCPPTGVCSYVQKHVIDALEGFSQFLAQETGKSLLEHQAFPSFLRKKLGKAF